MESQCSFAHEETFWGAGSLRVAGIDEAGRGPLAGPVVAAAVIFVERLPVPGLDDSKKLTAARRNQLYGFLTNQPGIEWAVAVLDSAEIDRLNILAATHVAMAQAVAKLSAVDHALVDGLPVKGLPVPHTALVRGDAFSLSIAAASVIAKVTRDQLMQQCHALYPQYGFDRHKGYPTADHLAKLTTHGPSPIHRHSFSPVANCLPGLL
ncbi:MAG: ribonuclease HII [Terrimicrobiaceae bacterium]